MSKLSFTVPNSQQPTVTGPLGTNSNPALPRRLSSAASSASGSPLTDCPRTFSSLEDSDEQDHEPDSSDDEDDRLEDELITSFNKFSCKWQKAKDPTGLLVIPLKPNPDWRKPTQKRRAGAARFIPDSAKASTSADGSVGWLGTRNTINSGPQLSGIQFSNKEVKVDTSTTSTDEQINKYDGGRTCESRHFRTDGRPKSPSTDWGYGLGASDRFYSRPPNKIDAIQQDVLIFRMLLLSMTMHVYPSLRSLQIRLRPSLFRQ
ncbi:hypothetical protein BDR03DRAFT_998793 [Suillus americanus]|nr:hypothetical protein BDR03DRAFT_998793 [Suillus americanus]